MRADLRRDCTAIWVIDCSPEGHRPEVATRIFQGVQHPVCITLAARAPNKNPEVPARLMFRALPEGRRDAKFAALAKIDLDGDGWIEGQDGLRDPFLPKAAGAWASFPALDQLFVYNGSGIMPGRTWVIAPDPESLEVRWRHLALEKNLEKKEVLFHPHLRGGKPGDKHIGKAAGQPLPGQRQTGKPLSSETDLATEPLRYAFRSLDGSGSSRTQES
jgi:hypothetical protein